MKPITKLISLVLLFIFLLTGACKANFSRNNDGSLVVETTITQQQLQEAISASIADPLIKDLTVSLQTGYVLVSGTRERLNDPSRADTLTFRLDIGASNGQLTTAISNAQLDGVPLDQERLNHWNETIANRLDMISGKNPNSTLTSVTISPEKINTTWTVNR
jgi:hypothetical protein